MSRIMHGNRDRVTDRTWRTRGHRYVGSCSEAPARSPKSVEIPASFRITSDASNHPLSHAPLTPPCLPSPLSADVRARNRRLRGPCRRRRHARRPPPHPPPPAFALAAGPRGPCAAGPRERPLARCPSARPGAPRAAGRGIRLAAPLADGGRRGASSIRAGRAGGAAALRHDGLGPGTLNKYIVERTE
jgi:hypothetical protein